MTYKPIRPRNTFIDKVYSEFMAEYEGNGNVIPEGYDEEYLKRERWVKGNMDFVNEILALFKNGYINLSEIQTLSIECGYQVWDSLVWQTVFETVYKYDDIVVKTEYKEGDLINND